ncbi:MAG: hypothetical protein HUJ53_01115 [Holdemanella sp.]|nr:hypothetical protein [Holdemanella sp.]
MKKFAKVLGILTAILAAVTALSMVVYYFNLDMKLTSKLEGPLDWWYDHVKRDEGL